MIVVAFVWTLADPVRRRRPDLPHLHSISHDLRARILHEDRLLL
jgi:hypothetical protein